ncbi:MAG: DUF4097 family beta strand repeat protein [Lachnospiraceae bacterium]|nr:DUF4097 family beta strand repeat protein [Lachnospiraceae bacterium]
MSTFEKVIKYAATAFAAILAVGIVVGILQIAVSIIVGIAGGNTKVTDKSYTFEADEVKSIYIDNSISNVTVQYYDGDTISIEAENIPEEFDCKVNKNGTLNIKNESPKNALFSFGSHKGKISVLVPEELTLKEFELNGGVGDITVNDLTLDIFTINGGVGDIDILNVTANGFSLDAGVGDFYMENCSANDTEIDGGVGDIEIQNCALKDVEIDNGIGDIDLVIDGDIDDYTFDMDGGIGSIRINGEKASYYKNNNGKYEISCDNGIGDIDITIE